MQQVSFFNLRFYKAWSQRLSFFMSVTKGARETALPFIHIHRLIQTPFLTKPILMSVNDQLSAGADRETGHVSRAQNT